MILFILAAIAAAAVRGYRVSVVFKQGCMAPLWVLQIILCVFQICAWRGDYRFLEYSHLLQMAGILVLLWPVMRFGLYKQAMFGAGAVVLGTMLNRVVMDANNGQMPVWPTLSRLTGYFQPDALAVSNDARHVLMSASTQMNFLADYLDTGFSILSIGDVLIHSFTAIVVFSVIASLNQKGQSNIKKKE